MTPLDYETLRLVVEAAPNVMILVDAGGKIVFANARTEKVLGYPPGELVGRELGVLIPERFRALHRGHERGFFHRPAARPMGLGRELTALRKDGTETLVEIDLTPVQLPDGPAVLASLVDVSEHRRADQLEAANRELEAFCHAASHDLKGPLRRMIMFGTILERELDGKIPEADLEQLRGMTRSAERLARLVTALLELSTASGRALAREPVDLGGLAREVFEELQRAEPGRRAKLTLTGDLAARGDAELLRAAVGNLLTNAWRYTTDRPEAVIEVGRAEAVYFVRDNGVGFDMTRADRLFRPFSRLHAREPGIPGSGLGLAIVRRIVERHGGRVWAEGSEQGAAFFFTLGPWAGAAPP